MHVFVITDNIIDHISRSIQRTVHCIAVQLTLAIFHLLCLHVVLSIMVLMVVVTMTIVASATAVACCFNDVLRI